MKLKDFYFDLPQELIAQEPALQRDSSRLLCMERASGRLTHRHFYNLADLLNEGDCLILNDSRVLPARLYGTKEGSGAAVEFVLLSQKGKDIWEALAGPGKKAKVGARFSFGEGLMFCEVIEILEGGNRLIRFEYQGSFFPLLEQVGQLPLPHYIHQMPEDKERYQTVYSKDIGSAAAPTAGLHFTDELLETLRAKGVGIGFVTLHVGLGTFRPVKAENIEEHLMHSEHYSLPKETAELISSTKKRGGRVIAVGTTSCRTLESVCAREGTICPSEGWTDIFIYPGYAFKVIDGLITNFHLPESTLIMLVSAFAGYEYTMQAYRAAVQEQYRFYSFGDAMFVG
ncbi:MAG: tRNA preQ1(34) S-adenosylmethionine ribosyltransferase-isomerase QueA [Oscillospiraceae bacterium]|jgi:S-adenosylmethionine:tRNA ribosyltransferase-isomerase|nr:tRNA preQ1(34) S-adenosylmethionine ribosyltransferase-isomerase QueA [Oscillospiraceae bacterium]